MNQVDIDIRKIALLRALASEGRELYFRSRSDRQLCEQMRSAGLVTRLVFIPGKPYYEITAAGYEYLAANGGQS